MKKGNLSFHGSIDLTQFWPQNIISKNPADSDADTVKVAVKKGSVVFRDGEGKATITTFLDKAGFFHAVAKKDGTKTKNFKSVINSKGQITMRLQGIDAPELHYMTQVHGNPLYRQHMGETSTVALYKFLKGHSNKNLLNCEVVTQVNAPNEVFDKYGRCVGDILIRDRDGKQINVNHWLIENGYAFPAFYNSMTVSEINAIAALALQAKGKKLNIWKFYSNKMQKLDRKLTHDLKTTAFSAKADSKSPVIFPKLFRRLWEFEIAKQNIFSTTGYQKFLVSKKTDACCKTSVFTSSGFPNKGIPHLSNFVSPNGSINFDPSGIVFKEGATLLQDKNQNPIKKF